MLGLLSRSRSLRGGGGGGGLAGDSKAHGPNAAVTNEPGLVSGPTLQKSSVLGLVENADVPASIPSPDGRNAYLDRPLPPPPPPKTSSVMLARPSTSSGNKAGKGLTRPFFDKRISRDDMFLNPYPQKASLDKRMSRDDMDLGRRPSRANFHVPLRGQLPTPDASPRLGPTSLASMPVRMATPESLMSGEIQIGMALGSPSHPPTAAAATWQPQRPLLVASASSSSDAAAAGAPAVQRSKTGRRKLFGFFGGGRKHQEPPKTSQEASDSDLTITALPSQNSLDPLPTRSNTTVNKKAAKYQPLVVRTNTEPSGPALTKEARPSRPFLRSKASEPAMRQQKDNDDNLASNAISRPPLPTFAPPAISASPYLDVEIPDVKMERYSIMFGSLLRPQQQQPASALLARRQATLNKLQTINDKILQEEETVARERIQRRATSPQPTKSPAFTLFPPTPSARKQDSPANMPQRLSPRLRSNTSPAMLPSPVKTSFDHHDPLRADRGKGNFLKVNPLRENPAMAVSQGRGRAEYSQPQPVLFNPTQSSLILDSPTEMEPPASFKTSPQPLKPTITEPQWQIMTPPSSAAPSTISSSASSMRKWSPSSVSSVQTQVTKASEEPDEPDTALKSAVEISIARQISISRQQRQLLRPLQTTIVQGKGRATPSPSSATKTSPVKKLGKNEKLQETRSALPTLMDSPLMHHRKSERVVLEAA